MYIVCSLRINCGFVFIFVLLTITLGLFAGSYWSLAEGNAALGAKLQVVGLMTLGESLVLTDISGRLCFRFCFLHGRLVSPLLATSDICRFPPFAAYGRLECQVQRNLSKEIGARVGCLRVWTLF